MALSLRPYQAEGIDFLADRGRAALFDEPGLGKTMQSLLAMRDLVPGGPLLVVSPGDAIGVWQDESEKWLDESASIYAGLGASEEALDHEGIVVTNYHRLANVLAYDVPWGGFIFDESQMLRNRKTRTLFDAVRKAAKFYKKAPMFFLSGSPVVKAAGDLWPILHLIDKANYNSYWRFVSQWANTWEDRYGWHVEGVTNVGAMWKELSQHVLRRTPDEVGRSLPGITRQRVRLQMTPKQARAYRDLEAEMMTELPDGGLLLTPTVLARETRLRQLLVCPRLVGIDDDGAALTAFRDVARESSQPYVLFTPFPEAFQYIEPVLLRTGRPLYFVRGGMGTKFKEPIALFNMAASAGASPILIASVHMGKGWEAQHSTNICYQLGWDWNNTTMKQAESRIDRDGQVNHVLSKYFVHDNTHDLDGLDVLSGKKRLSDAILDRARLRKTR